MTSDYSSESIRELYLRNYDAVQSELYVSEKRPRLGGRGT